MLRNIWMNVIYIIASELVAATVSYELIFKHIFADLVGFQMLQSAEINCIGGYFSYNKAKIGRIMYLLPQSTQKLGTIQFIIFNYMPKTRSFIISI